MTTMDSGSESWTVPHRRAEALADEARGADRRGDVAEARRLFALAADAEDEAVSLVGPDLVRTHGILAVSASSLREKAGDSAGAAATAARYLLAPGLPDFARKTLSEIADAG